MKVLVTGGCGFLGSHICEYFKKMGDDVVAFDNMTKYELLRTGYASDLARNYNLSLLKGMGVDVVKGDVVRLNELLDAAKDCDYIVHTAAQPAITISVEDAGLDFSVNAFGTFNVLEAARKYDLPLVNCSSIHVYGPGISRTLSETKTRYIRTPPVIDEKSPVLDGTVTPLHASKRSAEIYVQCFADTYGLKAATFRLTGMYGPNQFGGEDHGWVANFAIKTLLNKPISIFGTGKQVRDILYATDAASVFESYYKAQKPGIYNVGGGLDTMISLLECLDLIEELTNVKPQIKFEPERFGDLRYFVCDTSKASNLLGWKPKVKPREGVAKLVEWVQQNRRLFIG